MKKKDADMKKVNLVFLRSKGSVEAGYKGQFDKSVATNLIKNGIAEEISTKVKTKNKEKK
jgi:hypothetical protein